MNLDPQTLISRRIELSLQNIIPDMDAYAEEWNKLSADFAALGMLASAEMCFRNYQHYKEIADGEYIRLIEGSFAELIPTTDMQGGQRYLVDESRLHDMEQLKVTV